MPIVSLAVEGKFEKSQNIMKLIVGELKKGNTKSKSKDQISVIQNVQKFFDLREKIVNLFRDYSTLISEAKYKVKYGERLKNINS